MTNIITLPTADSSLPPVDAAVLFGNHSFVGIDKGEVVIVGGVVSVVLILPNGHLRLLSRCVLIVIRATGFLF
jgi:hypothetical protein